MYDVRCGMYDVSCNDHFTLHIVHLIIHRTSNIVHRTSYLILLSSGFIYLLMTEQKPAFKPSLGLLDATMIVAGSMIGSGIFIVSADMLKGSWLRRLADYGLADHRIYDPDGGSELWRAECDVSERRAVNMFI